MSKQATLKLSPAFCIMMAIMLLTLPLQWIFAAAAAAMFHEICHIISIRLCRGSIHRLSLAPDGAKLDVSSLTPGQEIICALAGPLGGLCLLFFSEWIPRIAVCAAFQSLYNLLPLYPLDGGRALWCGISMVTNENRAAKLYGSIETVCLTAIGLTAIYGAFILKLGISCLFPAILIVSHTKYRKIPCKQRLQRLQ